MKKKFLFAGLLFCGMLLFGCIHAILPKERYFGDPQSSDKCFADKYTYEGFDPVHDPLRLNTYEAKAVDYYCVNASAPLEELKGFEAPGIYFIDRFGKGLDPERHYPYIGLIMPLEEAKERKEQLNQLFVFWANKDRENGKVLVYNYSCGFEGEEGIWSEVSRLYDCSVITIDKLNFEGEPEHAMILHDLGIYDLRERPPKETEETVIVNGSVKTKVCLAEEQMVSVSEFPDLCIKQIEATKNTEIGRKIFG